MALGIGGTIQEIQGKLSHKEYMVWMAYRKKYGPITPVRKFDQAGAIVAAQINNVYGGKAKPSDFMPYHEKSDDKVLGAEEFISALAGAKGVKIGR